MLRHALPVAALAALLALTPFTTAGTPEEPELTDDAGDCAVAYGNTYMDVVSAWVSDETENDFIVNLAIAEWDPVLAEGGTGYTVQFTHQGVQWGVVATYLNGQWMFATGQVTEDSTSGFEETTGTFADGAPAVLSVSFPKGLFPHTEAMDHAVTSFTAYTADLRPAMPLFIAESFGAPVSGDGRWILCDAAEGDGTYMFQRGQHSMDGMSGSEETAPDGSANTTAEETKAGAETGADDASGPETAGNGVDAKTPAPGALAALAVGAGVAAVTGGRTRRAR